ncbi:hypothetical protein SDC9_62100 [bioreactor metagenome]|uniref:Uncharacterized protein n=1 Tax=bioreactor metagenome TaxID=1076179 RepID=A0A644XIV4_9ZZZZ
MVGALAEDRGGAAPGRADVQGEVRAVDGVPDVRRLPGGALLAHLGVAAEVRPRITEGGLPQRHEPLQVPGPDVLRGGVDVHGEVEEVAQRQTGRPVGVHPGRLQHVQALHHDDVGPPDHQPLVRHDVVRQVRVDRGGDLGAARLHVDHEAQQRPPVVRLGEALAVHDAAPFQLLIGVEEAVGGDQLDVGVVGPVAQQLGEQPGRRRLAHGDRAGDADDERSALDVQPQERVGGPVEVATVPEVQAEQPGQRLVDLHHVTHRRRVPQAAQPLQRLLAQR